jgi:ribonuclease G
MTTTKTVRKILVNINPFETRAALLENGVLKELFFENKDADKIVGCIFKGRVANIVPGTQSAFVDIGMARDAFLAFSNIDLGNTGDVDEELKHYFKTPVEDLLKVGQEIILQVLKEPTGTKGPRSTTLLSFPGRYMVLTPTIEHIGVSRRVNSELERDRLKAIGKRICPPGMGVIFRTVSEGVEECELNDDLQVLVKIWSKVEAKAKKAPLRSLIYRDLSLPLKLVRDYFTDEVERFIVDSQEEYKYILDFCDFLTPLQRASLELYTGPEPLFDSFGIEKEIQQATQRKIWLSSGGYLIIEQTEALVTIDVNSGRFAGGKDLEATVFKVNLEAAVEVARQVRLRNLAGMIVIDFIDLDNRRHRTQVLNILKESFKGDRNRPAIEKMSDLGLVQMTRKRTSHSLQEMLMAPCPCCSGFGRILSPLTLAQNIRREVMAVSRRFQSERIRITAQKEVIDALCGKDDWGRKDLEERSGRGLDFVSLQDSNLEFLKVEPII